MDLEQIAGVNKPLGCPKVPEEQQQGPADSKGKMKDPFCVTATADRERSCEQKGGGRHKPVGASADLSGSGLDGEPTAQACLSMPQHWFWEYYRWGV